MPFVGLSHSEFVARARAVHGARYDYSKSDYQGSKKKIVIICPMHGEFQQLPNAHLAGPSGCPSCADKQRQATKNATHRRQFEAWFEAHLGDQLELVSEYQGMDEAITVRCKRHNSLQSICPRYLRYRGHRGCDACMGRTARMVRQFAENRHGKAVRCLDTGKHYRTITAAAADTGISISSISMACSGRQKTAGGRQWAFLVE
jgi:hypothetical protein